MKVNKNAVRDAAKAWANDQSNWDDLDVQDRKAYKTEARIVLKGLRDEAIQAINDIYETFDE